MTTASDSPLLPRVPRPSQVWNGLRFLIGVAFVWFLVAAVPTLIVRYWFFESLGQEAVFRTNLVAQLMLSALGLVVFATAVAWPIRCYAADASVRRAGVHAALWVGILAGWFLSSRYEQFLLAINAGSFGEIDPVFGHDVGFYVFVLPALQTSAVAATALGVVWALSALAGRWNHLLAQARAESAFPLWSAPGRLVTPALNAALFVVGLSLVSRTFLARYGLLFKENGDTGVRMGAAFLDVDGVFSTLAVINVSTLVGLAIMAIVGVTLHQIGRRHQGPAGQAHPAGRGSMAWSPRGALVLGLLALDLSVVLGVIVRRHVIVSPNEPGIQIPYIERHIAATTRGYRLERVETAEWKPPDTPLSPDRLLASETTRNAPLLASWVSRLEEPPDVQHLARIRTSGSTLVYGPLLQVYEQEQQLRPYYRFISVDGVRYRVNGRRQMYVSAVRELPTRGFLGPRQWLQHWGSAALMLTHGMGLVMSPVNELTDEGSPRYAVADIPSRPTHPEFASEPRIYFGEGAKDDYILTGARHLREFDYATRQSRLESDHAPDVPSGIPVDSLWRRLVLALHTGDINVFLFSDFIDEDRTRVQLYRRPVERASLIAPFLFLDTNTFAFIAGGKILWMVNGLTTTANYPYSFREVLGDKADERAVESFPERVINYAEDSVKVTVDAYSGDVRFHRIADDPIVNTWARIYPGLFASSMPDAVRDQMSYPLQWFHIQFDDIYKRYHQRHPLEFYNAEDLWDDADEVLGSLGRGLSEFGTTDQTTFSYEGYNALVDPADLPAGPHVGEAGELQFALLMPFTPEGARNLRSLVVALQDGANYGRLLNYRVPQGEFLAGPEQADTLIDNDAQVNQQITLWVRHGSEVIRGHTLALPVGGDLIYIEPLWIQSLQNPLPQIKLFSVVYRGRTTMATTLDAALRLTGQSEADEQRANELPWLNEAQQRGR
ncbi:MAG: UPF0182 family protein [Acidobacteriota bacterium]